jgi:hypothetical protein
LILVKPPSGPPPLVAWFCVYAVNLIFPVAMGWSITREGGKIGMVIGIVAVFALGCRLCFMSRRAMLPVVYAGWIVAVSQLAPILHIFAGMVGVSVAHVFGDETMRGEVNTVLGGFLATIVTGGILIHKLVGRPKTASRLRESGCASRLLRPTSSWVSGIP